MINKNEKYWPMMNKDETHWPLIKEDLETSAINEEYYSMSSARV